MSGETYTRSDEQIPVRVSSSGGRTVLVNPKTGVWGEGSDHLGALLDFNDAVRETIEVLDSRPLSARMAEHLAYLRSFAPWRPVPVEDQP